MPPSSRNCYSSRLRILLCFAMWYALNVAYNVTNKWALDDVRVYVGSHRLQAGDVKDDADGGGDTTTTTAVANVPSALPLTIGCMQFLVGATYSIALWVSGIRGPVPHAAELSTLVLALPLPPLTSRRRAVGSPRRQTATITPALRGTFRIALYHTLGQLCTILCLSSNSIGFAHVIKAMEPLFSALAALVIFGQMMDVRVYLSLLPVVGGVFLACAGSDEFSWTSFAYGMGSNAFFAMRGVISKVVMDASTSTTPPPTDRRGLGISRDEESEPMMNEDDDVKGGGKSGGENPEPGRGNEEDDAPEGLSPANLFAAVTCVSFVLSVPVALIFEGSILRDICRVHAADGADDGSQRGRGGNRETIIFAYIIASGLFHYLNNEVMYLVLSNVHPITLAVGNTMKRVFIIVTGVLVFATPISLQTAIGSAIAIVGVFVYSLMKQWYGSSGGGCSKGSNGAGVCAKAL
jgi:solute carrier family 35 protein E1